MTNVGSIEQKSCRAQLLVVAGHTVLLEYCLLRNRNLPPGSLDIAHNRKQCAHRAQYGFPHSYLPRTINRKRPPPQENPCCSLCTPSGWKKSCFSTLRRTNLSEIL